MPVEGLTSQGQAPAAAAQDELTLLRAEVRRLTTENDRYRAHAERTSKLFLAATDYAEWVRESARRDAGLALRKARARVEQLEQAAQKLEEKEREHTRLQNELERLQAVMDETRARLSAFVTAGLEALNPEGEGGVGDVPESINHLQDALHSRLASTSPSPSGLPAEGTPQTSSGGF